MTANVTSCMSLQALAATALSPAPQVNRADRSLPDLRAIHRDRAPDKRLDLSLAPPLFLLEVEAGEPIRVALPRLFEAELLGGPNDLHAVLVGEGFLVEIVDEGGVAFRVRVSRRNGHRSACPQ